MVVTVGVPVFVSTRCEAERKACFANQRTVDSAVMQYYAENDGDYPNSLADLVPTWIKQKPTCRDTSSAYLWIEGRPPYITCLLHGRHDDD
jgi:hypothetical protein